MTKEDKRMVVMGGSFNPPTLAHFTLLREAIDAIDAWRGVFVPVSDAYLKRKMRRCHPPVVLAPAILPCFAKQMNGLGNTLLIFGKHAPDFGLLFCIWNRQNMHKKTKGKYLFTRYLPFI